MHTECPGDRLPALAESFSSTVSTSGLPYEHFYFLTDHLGSTIGLLDQNKALIQKYEYDSYGKLLSIKTPNGDTITPVTPGYVPCPFTYTGREWDSETGLLYLRARYYDLDARRFISEDPIWRENLYSYVYNNPINLVDPSGEVTEINELTGKVMRVELNGDKSILAFPYANGVKAFGPPQLIGRTLFEDAFIKPEGKDKGKAVGRIFLGHSIDKRIDFFLGIDFSLEQIVDESMGGGLFDLKTTYNKLPCSDRLEQTYAGVLFRGDYVTLREAGNILAGMHIAKVGAKFEFGQKMSGALNQGGRTAVAVFLLTGHVFGPPPQYGEIDYQYLRSRYGYDLYKKEGRPINKY